MDSRGDEYFDEETGEVMSPRENNMAAIDTADERITNQNNVDKNGNSATNSTKERTTSGSKGSTVSLDVNVNNVDHVKSVPDGKPAVLNDAEADELQVSAKQETPVDSGLGRHFRVKKSNQMDGSSPCGGNVKPMVNFSDNLCRNDNDSAELVGCSNTSSLFTATGTDCVKVNQSMDVDHCEQTTQRPPNIIHVSDADYSEDVLIQFGVDPYKWMYPKDLARPEKPQSPVPFHNESDLSDSEILTQFCSGRSKGLNSAQSKPRRSSRSAGQAEPQETETNDMRVTSVKSDENITCPSQPRKAVIKENERFRVPPKVRNSADKCGEKFDKTNCGIPLKTGRRAGMVRMESGESETGERKNRKTMDEVELNTTGAGTSGAAAAAAAGCSWNRGDVEQQLSDYVNNMGGSRDEFVQTDIQTDTGEDTKCTCPQCGHEMKLFETHGKKSPQDGEQTQDKENICNCDHSDKGPDWHALFMFKMFKIHSFMMNRGGRGHHPTHGANQGSQRPPFPTPPWVGAPWRFGCPMSQGTQPGVPPGQPSGAGHGPRQRFCAPWMKPPGGDNCSNGVDKPKDVPEAGAC